jgi:hypothetical protein
MANGNWSNINSEMAGKMISAVKGREDIVAAVANEANATTRGIPDQRAVLPA